MELKKYFAAVALGVMAACGGQADTTEEAVVAETAPAEQAAAPAAAPAAATGNVIEVKMIDEAGIGRFEPAEITAKPGDVIRYTLMTGVHNVSFPADKNAGKSGLPAASAFLVTPGQTYDVPVSMPAGEYTFQCDPHVAMGMVGKLTVEG